MVVDLAVYLVSTTLTTMAIPIGKARKSTTVLCRYDALTQALSGSTPEYENVIIRYITINLYSVRVCKCVLHAHLS